MNPLEKFERTIDKFLKPTPASSKEPVEVRREVLRDIADQVQPAGNGEYLFPYTAVRVELFATEESQQGPIEAMFSMPGFAQDVNTVIAGRGAHIRDLQVDVQFTFDPEAKTPYRIAYQRSGTSGPKAAIPRPAARLVVLEGQADATELVIERDLVYIGRLKQVINSSSGLERQNQLAFDASETTVSRKHARIQYDTPSGKFRVYNDPETVSISRDGRAIRCDATRGVQLRNGDEIILGKARLRFESE